MTFTIKDRCNNSIDVEALESVTPGLLITMCWEDAEYIAHKTDGEGNIRPKWHVTHVGTGHKLTEPPVSKRVAKLIAGALGGLPFDWMRSDAKYFYQQANAITDKALKHWLVSELRSR